MLLSKITETINGELVRDGQFDRLDYCTVKEGKPFLSFMEREKFLSALLENSYVSCVLCTKELADKMPKGIGVFVTDEPKATFEQIHNMLSEDPSYKLPDFKTHIGEGCIISPLAVIPEKNVFVGENVVIEPFVFIGEHVYIGNNCKIYNHATIGGRSFSYARIGEKDVTGLIDCGTVVLEEGVEVMSYSHLARGILPTDCTKVGRNTIIDAHVHIGHGAQLAKRVFIAAGAVIAGNCRVGDDSWVGVNATVSNRMVIGRKCRVSIGSVVTRNVPDGMTVSGNFAIEHSQFIDEMRSRK